MQNELIITTDVEECKQTSYHALQMFSVAITSGCNALLRLSRITKRALTAEQVNKILKTISEIYLMDIKDFFLGVHF